MKFSVIIPLYNKAPYIRKALESVLAQTYTDYELIIVDDGSTDGSAEIAEALLQEAIRLQGYEAKGMENSATDTLASRLSPLAFRLRLLKQPNQGVSAARNSGVAQSNGEYLAFLDADDWWEPTYLEHMAQLIEDYPDAGLYACNYVYYKPGKTHVTLNIPTGYINYPNAYYESNAMPVWTGAAMIPRKIYDEMGGFPLGIKLGEDFLLWAKIALRYPVAFLNEPLAWYNNDVPATLRVTRNLHAPEHHMLFRLELAFGDIFEVKGERLEAKGTEDEVKGERLKVKGMENSETDAPSSRLSPLASRLSEDWQVLLDKLRVNGLLEYWLDTRYHGVAAKELAKVNWNLQPNSIKRIYKTPIWLLKLKRLVMQVGSCIKQSVYRLKFKG
ncbi:MAG: glycosyltransferase family 2 protein [Paludibacteraceae bacterium]|nr:glycosyltransferase family 2 protein [Paludibacteraceae bacterium]